MKLNMASSLARRQSDGLDYGDDGWWGYSTTAFIIKWIIVGVIFILFLLFFVGGWIHARQRMKKGLPPLRYHRWLVSRQDRARFFPPAQNPYNFYRPAGYGYAGQGQAFPMHTYGPPPPAYQEPDYVPAYTPPPGSSKVNPDQFYTAPPGAPQYVNPSAGPSNQDSEARPTQPLRASSAFGNK